MKQLIVVFILACFASVSMADDWKNKSGKGPKHYSKKNEDKWEQKSWDEATKAWEKSYKQDQKVLKEQLKQVEKCYTPSPFYSPINNGHAHYYLHTPTPYLPSPSQYPAPYSPYPAPYLPSPLPYLTSPSQLYGQPYSPSPVPYSPSPYSASPSQLYGYPYAPSPSQLELHQQPQQFSPSHEVPRTYSWPPQHTDQHLIPPPNGPAKLSI